MKQKDDNQRLRLFLPEKILNLYSYCIYWAFLGNLMAVLSAAAMAFCHYETYAYARPPRLSPSGSCPQPEQEARTTDLRSADAL